MPPAQGNKEYVVFVQTNLYCTRYLKAGDEALERWSVGAMKRWSDEAMKR
jgi:hypothetical protein